MPRKKKPGKQGGGSEASSKHAKHAKNAGAGPPGGKGRKKVDKEETRAQNLQQLQDMFEGKLDAVLVHMIMEDCNYNVENALETLFKLASDASNPAASDMNPLPEKPRDLVSYSKSEESDESEDLDGFPNGLYLPHHVTPGETVAGSGTDAKRPLSSANGVGLDDISLPPRIAGLDCAISMAKDLDRNTFSEESVEKVTAGLLAYRDTGDRNKLKELGTLRAIAEMVLEVGVKEEEKERAESSKVQFKSLHSRLPVYSATDDRLVGGMSSSSGSSGSSSPSQSDDERDKPDGPYPAEDDKKKSESKEACYEAAESKDAGARAASQGTPRTAPAESSEKLQENPSLNNGDADRRLPSTNPNLSNMSTNFTPLSTTENRNDEAANIRPKATVSFWNNLTPEQGETDDASDEDSEKDIDKHISFQEDSEIYGEDRPERDSCHDIASSERSNLLKSQQQAKPNNSTERSHDVYPPGGENLSAPFSVERPFKQPDERFFRNERGQGAVNMPLPTRPQQRLSDIPQGPVQVENNQFHSQYTPLNASPAATNLHGKNTHKRFVYDANFAPGFGMGTTHFFVRNMSPGLLPRTYHKDGQPPKNSSQPWPNQGYSRAFYAQMPLGTATKTSGYPPHNIFRFQGPRLRSPTVPRSNVTITELPDSPEEPLTSTNVEEVSLGPPRWPVIQQTNLKRHDYPAQSPRTIPPLPPGKVLCLMRGCPGSGKSTVAKSLKGNGVVLSTDDFFIVRGKYVYDRTLVGEAHDWNHARAQEYLAKGTTPIVIDNTNIMTWEMKPYVAMALKHQYQVVIREPDTPWKKKAGELAKRNSHGVPKLAIERMLQNYDPHVTVESIMNGPDKKKTPEYVAKLNQEDPDLPGEDVKPPRVSRVSGHQGGQQGGHQGGQTRRGDGGRSHHQDNAPGDEKVIDDEGWERVGRHSKGDQWNHQRGARDGRKDLNQRNNLKSGSPRRYNNEHPANRYHSEGGEDTRASGRTKNGPYNSPSKAQSPSRSVRTPPRDRSGTRRDGPQHDDEGWISSPKRGKRTGGSPSPSPNRAYQNKRIPNSPQRGQQNQGKHAAPKSQHNKPSDAAIRFLESDKSLSQDPMKRLINHIGTGSQTLASNIGEKRSVGKTDQNGKALENGERQKHVASPLSSGRSQPRTGMPMRQDLIQEVTIDKTMASDTESLLLNTQLSSSDDQKGSSSASAASLQEDPALDGDEKTYGTLLAENLQGNIDRSLDMPGKMDLSVDVTTRSEEDVSLQGRSDYGRNINLTGRDSPQCDVRKTASDNPIKQTDAEQSPPLKGNFMTNCTEAQNSETMQEKLKSVGVGRIEAEFHTSCQDKESDCSTVEGPPLISPVKIEDQFECAPKTKPEAISPLKNEEETISPSQCQSRESSRASTPSLRRTTRRLSGGQSTRRLAAVFTSPMSPDPPGPVNADWSKYDPSRSIPKPTAPDPSGSVNTDWSKYDPSRSMPKPASPDPLGSVNSDWSKYDPSRSMPKPTSPDLPGSVNTDWAKYDPSRSIPKPTFPISKQETTAVKVNLCDKSTEINGQDFAYLQRIISGTMEPEDLPAGYVCRTPVARLLSKADKSGGNETGEEDDQDRSSPIPMSVKLHKSCMTEEIVEETNLEEEKVSRMQGCFPTSSAKDLKSLLETCNGDVEMATNILLDSLALGAASSPEDRSTPKDEVPTKVTETSHAAFANPVSGNKVVVAEELAAGNDHGIGFANDQTGKKAEQDQASIELRANSPDNLPTSQRLDKDTFPSDMSASRHDALKQLASDSQRFASELKQANQIYFSNDLKTHTEQTLERAQPRPCDASSKTNDTDKRTVTVEMNDTAKSDVQSSKDNEFHKQEGKNEQQEQEEDTDSEEFEFSNNFYSGASKLLKPKIADTSDDELPPLESFREDRQMLQLAAACHNRDNVVHGHYPIKENPHVPLHQRSEILPVTLDKPAPEQVREETINPALQTEVCVTPQTKPDLPATSSAKVEEVHVALRSDQLTPQPEPESQRVDEDDSKDMKDLLELGKEDSESGTLLSTLLSGPNSTMNDPRDNERMAGGVSYRDPKTNDQESGKSSPKLPQGMERPEGDVGGNSVRFGASLEEPSVDELSDSDIPWKSGFDVIEPGADREAAVGDPSDKFTDSGEGVYDYLGGMELQMDAAFALQLQELFGQVGFHLNPDMLSADALKVKIGYQVAKQLHSAWSTGLAERFQDQERQVEEMLQRDEELARRLQQEENLKKLAKSHRDKKPTKGISSPGGSPKWNKRRQKESESPSGAVANGGQEAMRGEQLLVGGGLRNLGGLGAAVGGAGSPGKYPPPVQRVEVPELAQIMAEEELRQEREKKGMWSSPSPVRANTIATKLKRDQLFEAFPDVDRNALDDIFKANNYEFQSTMWEVNAVFREPAGPVKEVFSPEALVEREKRRDSSPARRKAKGQSDSTDGQFQSTEQPDYEDYRAEATLHFKQRDECFKKAAKAYHAGQKELALYYSNQGRLHSMRLKEANRRAAELILVQRKQVTGENKLDLHNLHVEEALQALQEVLIERQMHPSPGHNRYLEVVTGRGRHSKMGVAKLKPAVCKFLEQKGYRFTAPNAGCLKVYFSP